MVWMIEGRWSGPSSPAGDYTGLVHREYTNSRKFVEAVCELGSILYSDGTRLFLSAEQRTQRTKRPPEILGYGKLIRDCIHHGVNSVDALPRK